MFSLALIFSFIFIFTLFSGPFSLVLNHFGMPILGGTLAGFSIVFGAYWCCLAPFPVSLVGCFSAICGAITLSKI